MSRGTAAQKERWALDLLTFDKVGAWAITEPDSGSDAFGRMQSTARSATATSTSSTGRRPSSRTVPYADTTVFICKLDEGNPAAGAQDPLVRARQGDARLRADEADAQDGHALVADRDALPRRRARRARTACSARPRTSRTARARSRRSRSSGPASPRCRSGSSSAASSCASRTPRRRVRFGKPIGDHQLIQEKLARMEVHRLNTENLVFRSLEKGAAGRADGPHRGLGDEALHRPGRDRGGPRSRPAPRRATGTWPSSRSSSWPGMRRSSRSTPVPTRSRSPRSPAASWREVDSSAPMQGQCRPGPGEAPERRGSLAAAPNGRTTTTMANRDLPRAQGLYDPAIEHDACGVAFVVDLHGRKSHDIVAQGLTALCNLDHRGASGAEVEHRRRRRHPHPDPRRVPPRGRRLRAARRPARTRPASRSCPRTAATRDKAVAAIDAIVADEGLRVLGWRDVPTDDSMLGAIARRRRCRRSARCSSPGDGLAGHRRSSATRSSCASASSTRSTCPRTHGHGSVYFPSLSCRTLVYKGMLTHAAARGVLPRPARRAGRERARARALAVLHQHVPVVAARAPVPLLAHNGEINTAAGQPRTGCAPARRCSQSDLFPGDLERIFPICTPGRVATRRRFDEVLELLHLGGRSLPHAVLDDDPGGVGEPRRRWTRRSKAFYRFHASLMEPWDGPASIAFTDGTVIGAVLDRNGLRPSRYWVTDDDLVIMASEVGVLDVDAGERREEGPARAGQDVPRRHDAGPHRRRRRDQGRRSRPSSRTSEWLDDGLVHLDDLPPQ